MMVFVFLLAGMSPLLPSATDSAAEDESVSDVPCAFEPRVAVVVGVLAALLCMTFFLVLYGRHCKRIAARFRPAASSSSPASQMNLDSDGNVSNSMVTGSLMIDHHHHQAAALRLPYDSNGGLAQWVIDALPKFQSSSELLLKQQVLDCPVCLSRYEDGDLLRLLPRCKHAFHVACVDKWLLSRPSCPVCRTFVSCQDIVDLDNYYLHKNDTSSPAAAALPQHHETGEEPAAVSRLEVIVVDSNLDRSSRDDHHIDINSRSFLSSWDDQMVLTRSRDLAPAFMQQQQEQQQQRWSDFSSADNAVAYQQHHRFGSDMRRSASLGSLSYKSRFDDGPGVVHTCI